jgi:hypothetical protein
MNNITRFAVLLAVTYAGLSLTLITDAIKTDKQIIAEIRSMASSILKECPSTRILDNCSAYKDRLDNESSIALACSAMDGYSSCKSSACTHQSQALKQLFSDAVIIPYCTSLFHFWRSQVSWDMADRLADMSKLCQFKWDEDCDLELDDFFSSQQLASLCFYWQRYAMCLEVKCLPPALELMDKIEAVKNDSRCRKYAPNYTAPVTPAYEVTADQAVPIADHPNFTDSKLRQLVMLNTAMDNYCQIGSSNKRCDSQSHDVELQTAFEEACMQEKYYIKCLQDNCIMSQNLQDSISNAKLMCNNSSPLQVSIFTLLMTLLAKYL